jgi:hypothetical protein
VPASPVLLPDSGPLVTLAYADALDLLFLPGWPVQIVDMVLHEVTRNQTPTSQLIGAWVSTRAFLIFLEQKGWLPSAAGIERKAILNGRNFSQLRFPPA